MGELADELVRRSAGAAEPEREACMRVADATRHLGTCDLADVQLADVLTAASCLCPQVPVMLAEVCTEGTFVSMSGQTYERAAHAEPGGDGLRALCCAEGALLRFWSPATVPYATVHPSALPAATLPPISALDVLADPLPAPWPCAHAGRCCLLAVVHCGSSQHKRRKLIPAQPLPDVFLLELADGGGSQAGQARLQAVDAGVMRAVCKCGEHATGLSPSCMALHAYA